MSEQEATHAWTDEDGNAYIEVALIADRVEAGRRWAAEIGMVTEYVSRVAIRTQDCECSGAPVSDCPDGPGGQPCVVREGVDCWHFEDLDVPSLVDPENHEGSLLFWPPGTQPMPEPDPYFAPVDIPVAPGQEHMGL